MSEHVFGPTKCTAVKSDHEGLTLYVQINDVEATYPYNTNNVTITPNADDRVFSTESADASDPVFEYVYLGDELSDGLFGWITIAVNTSATYDPNYSFVLTESGGVAESGGSVTVDGGSGDGGDTGGNGTAPSGSFSGAVPSGTAVAA